MAAAMSEKFTIRAKKFLTNPMLSRKQMVIDVLHPTQGSVSKKSIREKLATAYKVNDLNCIHVFGLKTAFGGGKSTGFALVYDNLAAAKKYEPKHRLKRVGLAVPEKKPRRQRKDIRKKQKKFRGKAKAKVGK